MKTTLVVIAGICIVLGVAFLPVSTVKAAGNGNSAFQNDDTPALLQCSGQQKGNQTGPRDGTKGENAPRDGRGKGSGARDGSGKGAGRGQGGGPRDGSGQNCPK